MSAVPPARRAKESDVDIELTEEEVAADLTAFIKDRFLGGDAAFDEVTPLFESGVLTSLNSAILLNHIQREHGAAVPLERMDEEAFKDVRSIAAMLCELARQGASTSSVSSM
jgi:clorobiocin biosynthesis protein CloN5